MPVCFTSSEDSGGGSTTPHDRDQSFPTWLHLFPT